MRRMLTVLTATSALAVAGCAGIGTDLGTTPIPGNYLVRAVDGTPMPEGVTFNLQADGSFSGHAPCNEYSGASVTPLPGFSAGEIATTRKACTGNAMRLEQRFLTALAEVNTVGQGDEGMTLSGVGDIGTNTTVISLRRLPIEAPVVTAEAAGEAVQIRVPD